MKVGIISLLVVLAVGSVAVALLRRPRGLVEETPPSTTTFVFIKVPESIMPIERGEKYEDPLDAALKSEKLGEVTGGGSQLSEPDANGDRTVAWVGLDVELIDLERGLPFLKTELSRLGAPAGSTLEFTRAGQRIVENISG